jgi:hypothetical protein
MKLPALLLKTVFKSVNVVLWFFLKRQNGMGRFFRQ